MVYEEKMKVSVVLCTYSTDIYEDFKEALESLLKQSYPELEIICVVDGNRELYDLIREENKELMKLYVNDENKGLLYSRNKGVEESSGDVVAFIDDDAIAEKDWIERFVEVYTKNNAIAAGGNKNRSGLQINPNGCRRNFIG